MPSLLGMPAEIQDQIFECLWSDPSASPSATYFFFILTCRSISLRAEKMIERFPVGGQTEYIRDWRLARLDSRLSKVPLQDIQAIRYLYVETYDADIWAPDARARRPNEEDATLNEDEDGLRFREAYDEDRAADWVMEMLERFPGVEFVKLWKNRHGYPWNYHTLIRRLETLGEEKKGGRSWKIVEKDEIQTRFLLEFDDPDHVSGAAADWRLRRRDILITI